MPRAVSDTSLLLIVGGLLAALAPSFVLAFSRPEPYEVGIVRWIGAAALVLAAVRPRALRMGDAPARRMRRWNGTTIGLALLYVVTTNPLFLILAFATLAASVLDAGVEWATIAAEDLRQRLLEEADGA